MKTKFSNKFNILLIAIIMVLLVFVAFMNALGTTGAWLNTKDEIGFQVNVDQIKLSIKQGDRKLNEDGAETGLIYLGTNIIEAGVTYLDDVTEQVTITNDETSTGYYIRCQAFAVVNGVTYNINNCITSDLESYTDGWMYSEDAEGNRIQMPPYSATDPDNGSTLVLMKNVTFPQSFVDQIQGQLVKLHIFIEGSAIGWEK